MKEMVVISGKGGTGKTVITANFAVLAQNKVIADCDVDAADLHLLTKPNIEERHEFKSSRVARIESELCKKCGKCSAVCRFNAINGNFSVDSIACEGCTVCSLICPEKAIKMEEESSGEWFISKTRYGTMVHARLGAAKENSGKLVTVVRKAAKEIGEREGADYCIIDGPPGIGCPVIASLAGVDFALIVTEPTLSGLHDLIRVAHLARQQRVKISVCINKYDINLENTEKIKEFCSQSDIDIAGEIPFEKKIVESLVRARPFLEHNESTEASRRIKKMWVKIQDVLDEV